MIPGELQGRPVKLDQLVYYLIWDGGSMLGTPVLVASTIVIAFVLFGFLLFESGGSDFFTDVSLALMGRYRGGSAKIAITASGLIRLDFGKRRFQCHVDWRDHHPADASGWVPRANRRCH